MDDAKLRSKIIKARKLVMSGVLSAPESFRLASINELMDVCNGCGAANAKFDFVPDRIWGTDISASCQIHDWEYSVGLTNEDKEVADRRWRNNLFRTIDADCKKKCYKPRRLMRRRAKSMYFLVDELGGSAFWDGKNKLESLSFEPLEDEATLALS